MSPKPTPNQAAFSVLWSYVALSYTWAPGGKVTLPLPLTITLT